MVKKKVTLWDVVPKSYRSTIKGKKYVLARGSEGGTVLAPVSSKEAKKTWGKYLKRPKCGYSSKQKHYFETTEQIKKSKKKNRNNKHEWVKSKKGGIGWQECKKCGAVKSLMGRYGGGILEEYGCTNKMKKMKTNKGQSGWFMESRRHREARLKGMDKKRKSFKSKKYKDSDGDGVPDYKDCKPFNPKRQDKWDEFSGKKTLTEQEVNLMMRRINSGKLATLHENRQLSHVQVKFPDEGFKLTKSQQEKGYKWLMNLWKTPRGIERKNNPFGWREQDVLDNFEEIRLIDVYSDRGYYYVPYYRVESKDSSFEYCIYGGQIHILG